MKVLLLGATGLLGHNVLQRLVAEGHSVVALVRRAVDLKLPQGGWETLFGSPLDYATLYNAADGCEAIINCTGTTDMSLRRYEDFLPVNRDLCGLLLKVMEERGIDRLVHTSSVNTIGYGTAAHPANETMPMRPPFSGSFYAESKREGEEIVLSGARSGRHVVVINPGYMLGPYDTKPSSGRMLLAAYRKPVMVAPKGGKAFVHVADVAQTVVNALVQGCNGHRYIVVNSHACFSIKELYHLQADVCGYRQRVVELPGWMFLAAGRVGDAMRCLGIKTQVSTRNVRQLLVREYYDNGCALRELGMEETPLAEAIAGFHQWRIKENNNNKEQQ